MKVVTWNIDFKTENNNLWKYIQDNVKPDVLLVQECKDYPNNYNGVGTHIDATRRWGSMVLINKSNLEPIQLDKYKGWVAGAKIDVANRPISVFSLHAKLKGLETPYVVPHLKKIIDDIFHTLSEEHRKNVVIAGDFNAARLYDHIYKQPENASHKKFFDWLETNHKLISTTYKIHNKEIQTMRGNSKHPYQNDHIYITNNLHKYLSNSYIMHNSQVEILSDHNPVVAEFDFSE